MKQFHLQSCMSRGPFEGVGLLKRICKDACRVYRHNTRDTSIRHVRRSGSRFPETVSFLEHQIVSFAKMILRYRCSTSYDLVSLFRGRRSTLERLDGKITKRIGTKPSALHLERSLALLFRFLMLPKLEEVSQNLFVLDLWL